MTRSRHLGRLARAVWSLATPAPVTFAAPAHGGVRYAARTGRGVAPLVDLYLPPGSGPHPSVLIFHGGGFVIGSRRMKPVRLLATRLGEAGFAVGAFDYRLIFRGGRLRHALEDAEACLDWWWSESPELGVDPARTSLLGLSAGACLMLMQLARRPVPAERLVSFFGLYDFATLPGVTTGLLTRLLFEGAAAEVAKSRSPMATAGYPQPLLLLHGTDDALVPVEQAQRLAAAREALGLETRLRIFEDAPHGFLNDVGSAVAREAIEEVLDFLTEGAAGEGAGA